MKSEDGPPIEENYHQVELTEVGGYVSENENETNSQDKGLLAADECSDGNVAATSAQSATSSSLPLPPNPTLQRARRLLYVSHLFAQASEQSWQFCLTIFLAAFTNYRSLLLVSTYGLTTGLAVTLLGSTTGSWIDRTNRLMAARGFIFIENACVIVATVFSFLLLRDSPSQEERAGSSGIPTDMYYLGLIVGIHFLGATARVLDGSFLVAMERDWVVVMSRHGQETINANSREWLTQTNVAMKQIDLSCKIAAPAISGFFIALVDNRGEVYSSGMQDTGSAGGGSQFRFAALVVGFVNALALIVEYYCTTIIYESIPDLAVLKSDGDTVLQSDNENAQDDDEEEEEAVSESETSMVTQNASTTLGKLMSNFLPQGLQVYFQQSTSLAGLGLAMLYLNALTFDAIMTAYLIWRGMGMQQIGIWRGISSAIGLLGTFVYHWSVQRMALETTGLWAIIYEFACLSLSYASLFVVNDNSSLAMLIAGVCASRIGLWVFDISVTQMMQEYVPDGVRGTVGGVQQSLNAFFNLFSYALGIVFSDPKDFYIYVVAGYLSVGVAMLLYGFDTFYSKKGSAYTVVAKSPHCN